MDKAKLFLLSSFLLCLLCSCGDGRPDRRLADSIERTWLQCETDLHEAGVRAERLKDSVCDASEYVRQAYDLLCIRLRDKSRGIPSSPDSAMHAVTYFSQHGSDIDRERACYYLGSAYRDLKDYPQAVNHFLKAVDAAEQSGSADTIIWLNALSQLGNLYMLLLNYEEELNMALQAAELAKTSFAISGRPRGVAKNLGFHLAEVASAYRHLNDTLHCLLYLDEAYRIIQSEHFHPRYGSVLAYMLTTYSSYDRHEMRDTLLQRLSLMPEAGRPQNYDLCVARSYEDADRTDSAILHYTAYYNKEQSIAGRYEASAGLQRCYLRRGDFRQAAMWGSRLYDTNDTIIAERAFEETQRARDTFVYYRDREREQAILQRNRQIMLISVIAVLTLLCIMLGGAVLYKHRKKKFDEEIDGKEKLLHHAKEEIQERSAELMQRKRINKELTQMVLMDSAVEGAGNVIEYFSRVAVGKEKMRDEAWKELMSAVEILHPGFHEAVQGRLQGQLREPLLRTICLMKIGMKPTQIANIMDVKKQTAWNRVKRAESTCGDLLSEVRTPV